MKEWIRATHPANGPTTVTVTLQEGNLTAKWTVKAYTRTRDAVTEARRYAQTTLDDLKEAS